MWTTGGRAALLAARESIRTRCGASRRGQAGSGLIEVLIALVVIATIMMAASAGLFTAVDTSGDNQTRQRLQASLSSYSDSIKQLPYASACADSTPAKYNAAYATWAERWTPPSGVTVAVDTSGGVTYWDRTAKAYTGTCPSTDTGAQLLKITVTDGTMSASGQVVKRNPGATP